jgi:hypothetical protein
MVQQLQEYEKFNFDSTVEKIRSFISQSLLKLVLQ